jgi:cardiolipin synthase
LGIADEWAGNAQSSKVYRDTHYRIDGPVVSQLQSAFAENWMETTGEVLLGNDFFPKIANAGTQRAQVFKSSPRGGSESMELMYFLSIAAAKKNIRLATGYFVPEDLMTRSLIRARQRGVSVQIIVPGRTTDEKLVRFASRARWGELLKAGVQIYEYGPAMYHSKLMIVDDAWVSIGSANLDNRSFRLNDEANLNVLDAQFASEQIRIFEADLMKSDQITYEKWMTVPPTGKAADSFLTIFGWLM